MIMEKNTQKKEKKSKLNLYVGLFLVFFFALLVQKEASLPSWVILIGALIGFFFLFILSFKSPMPGLMTLVCYVPFSKILVGDFGGVLKALNFTNILMIFVFIGMFSQFATKGKKLFEKNPLNLPVFLFCLI